MPGMPFASLLFLGLLLAGCGTEPDQLAKPESVPGRQQVLQCADPATVQAIDALGLSGAERVYRRIAAFSDQFPQLLGTRQQACAAVQKLVALSSVGAEGMLRWVDTLENDTPQGLWVAAAQESDGRRRRDSLEVASNPNQSGLGRNREIEVLLSPQLPSMARFHGLRLLNPESLPPLQREVLRQLRQNLKPPSPGETLRKVIRVGDIDRYLNGTFDPKVFGATAQERDTQSLTTPAQLISGLRLDYPGGYQNENQVGVMVYSLEPGASLRIPFSSANGGDASGDYPFTGNGFTATVQAMAIPEWQNPSSGAALQRGARLLQISADGQSQLRGTWNGTAWETPGGSPLPRRVQQREPVEEWRTILGYPAYVISQDSEFLWVYGQHPEMMQEPVQVGPKEYRGRVPR